MLERIRNKSTAWKLSGGLTLLGSAAELIFLLLPDAKALLAIPMGIALFFTLAFPAYRLFAAGNDPNRKKDDGSSWKEASGTATGLAVGAGIGAFIVLGLAIFGQLSSPELVSIFVAATSIASLSSVLFSGLSSAGDNVTVTSSCPIGLTSTGPGPVPMPGSSHGFSPGQPALVTSSTSTANPPAAVPTSSEAAAP